MDARFVETVRGVDPDVTCDDLADIVWLAMYLTGNRHRSDRDDPPSAQRVEAPHPSGSKSTGLGADPPPDIEEGPVGRSSAGSETAALRLPPRRFAGDASGVSTRSPAVAAIPNELDILRALLPLQRHVPSTSETQPDEAATANWIAETGLWIPRVLPVRERWLDVALVVDHSASMAVWQRTVAELRTLLERSGAFRDVRVWHLDGDLQNGPTVTISAAATETTSRRGPGELVDPAGRRLVMIATDCVGRAWSTGSMGRALATWASTGPTVIVQMLPQRLWEDCAPEFIPVCLRGIQPGLPNKRLMVTSRAHDVDLRSYGAPVPVLELDGRWLKPWASLVSGAAGSWVNSTAVFADIFAMPQVDVNDGAGSTPIVTSKDQVRAFRAHASPTAYQLAVYLAAGAPLTLTVMRLVQGAMLPRSRPSHLAEVFLSDLLRKTDGDGPHDQIPDDIEYEFQPGVRDELLEEIPRQDALQVLSTVSNFVSQRLGSSLDFRALLTATDAAAPASLLSPPFAQVAYKVLASLGGRYAEAAERLTRIAALRRSVVDTNDGSVPNAGPGDHRRENESGHSATGVGPASRAEPGREVLPRIMRGVPGRNPLFTGRAELLNALHDVLVASTEQTVLVPNTLHGLGGVGKTHLAVEYVYRFADEYDLVCWLPAHDLTQLRASLVELGGAMGLPDNPNVSRAVDAVLDSLRTGTTYQRWLLVFDNADQPEDLQPYLPIPTGHVLITSRNAGWSEVANAFEIDVFTREESIALLRERVATISTEDADRLAERLGDLPLALDQAGAWQAATGMPVNEYLRLFDDQFERLTATLSAYPNTVGATYVLTLDRLREQAPGAAQLLDVCAFFGAEPISVNLLWDGREADLPSPLDQTLRDENQLRRALREIGRYALARVDSVHDQLTIHRLVQDVIRSRLDGEELRQARLAAQHILADANPSEPDLAKNWPRHGELSPHIVPAELIDGDEERSRLVVLDQIRFRWTRGDYESSRDLGELTVNTWRARWGRDDVLTLLSCRHLAIALRTLGQYTEARALAEDTLVRFRRVLGDDHEHTLFTGDSVAWDHRISGNFHEARKLDEDNRARFRHTLGEKHPLTLKAANNFAIDLRWLGDFAEARKVDEESVRRRRDLYGEENRHTQLAVASLARDHYGLGDYYTGLRLQETALAIQRRLLGPTNAEVLSETRNLIVLLRKCGQQGRARDMAGELVQTYERRFGPHDEPTLAANMSYVNALHATNQHAAAQQLGENILERYQRAFETRHPATLACATNLAIVLRHRGAAAEAHALNTTTLAAFRAELGDSHPFTLCCATNTANDLAALQRHGEARVLSEDTLRRSRETRGDDHPDTLACALDVAIDRRATGAEDTVEPLLSDTLARFGRRLGENHPSTLAATTYRRADCDIEPPET